MAHSTTTHRRRPTTLTRSHHPHHHHHRSWCCSFAVPPSSPENSSNLNYNYNTATLPNNKGIYKKAIVGPKPSSSSFPPSPQSSKSSGLNYVVGRIDRILSPGRVSPIDSDPTTRNRQPPSLPDLDRETPRSGSFRARPGGEKSETEPENLQSPLQGVGDGGVVFDVRLNLRGKKGGGLVLEMNSGVLVDNSEVFAGLIWEYRKGLGRNGDSEKVCRLEVSDVENLGVFRETIELMFEEEIDIPKRLLKVGAFRAISILEVSAGIKFQKGVISCLKYLEAVPWTEEEEEKLRSLFSVFKFNETTTEDIMARLYMPNSSVSQQNLARQLVWSITTCADASVRTELKSLVRSLLCRSSVYEKNQSDLSKEDLYAVCQSCLESLISLFKEACEIKPQGLLMTKETGKTLIERISLHVDNILWLLEILLDRQMAEEFVELWADQQELLIMHQSASPMVRYEISRVSAILFVAMGTRKLHCRSDTRAGLLQAWFGPMLLDFGWLQRCKKGLDMKALEESMGQTLLTLPLKQQYNLFMEWFRCFSKHGTECPNLSKAFQIWWRRSFLRGSEACAVEFR